jgi:hypothetical protein
MGSLREALSPVAGRAPRDPAGSARPARRARSRGAAALALLVCSGVLAACGAEEDAAPAQPQADVELPLQQTADLREAVEAAGCELINRPSEGNAHAERQFTAEDYGTNPPTSGEHHPEWYDDGIYEPGTTDNLGMLVHTLEHGRINVQYKPGTPEETADQLEALLAESEGYHMLLYENNTGMDYAVAATAWEHLVGCPEMNDKVFDALRTFRTRYIDKAPEQVP